MSDSKRMYRQAHDLHYKSKKPDEALALYRQVVERFPNSPEANYAQSQISNIDGSEGPQTFAPASQDTRSLEERIAEQYKCPKCTHTACTSRRIAVTGAGLSRLFDLQKNYYLGLSCAECGYAEFYDLNVLEQRGGFGGIALDLLVGK